MIIAASIKKLLDSSKYSYRALHHKRVSSLEAAASLLNINLKQVITAQVLADKAGAILIVYPLGRKIDLQLCKQGLRRDLTVIPSINTNRIFNDCEAGSWPAIGQPYNIEVILDKSIKQLDTVYFASGSHTSLLQMSIGAYLQLNSRAKILNLTAELPTTEALPQNFDASSNLQCPDLPILPPVAMQILQLSISKEHSTKDLIDLVTEDSGMQQQIMYYMQLPFIQKKFSPESSLVQTEVQHAVEHVLGFDMVSHIALGVAAGRAFDKERTVAGNTDFWRHAFYAASYAEQITKLVAEEYQLDPAISYLAGLFHNFGLLLLSYLFPPEYNMLNKWLQQNPKVCISTLEKRLLGMGQAFNIARGGHAQLGEILLRSWQLPEAICVITKEHHSVNYNGKYERYVKIIQLTNQLLREEGIGDGTTAGSEQLLESLGLSYEQVYASVKQIKDGATSIESMARSLTS